MGWKFLGVAPQSAKSAHEFIKVAPFFDMSHPLRSKAHLIRAKSHISPVSNRLIDFLGRDLLENSCTLASTCISNHLFQRKPLHPSLPMHLVQCLERGVGWKFLGVAPQTAKSAHELTKVALFFEMSHPLRSKAHLICAKSHIPG